MLHFEETGALVAGMTTSIPKGPDGGNFDFRYCWLRNSYEVVHALNNLGATATMESFLNFLSNIVADFTEEANGGEKKGIQSVYGLSLETRLFEREMHRLPGYRGMGPVKLGNKECEEVTHEPFGTIVMALTQTFFDRRLKNQGDIYSFGRLEVLGEEAKKNYSTENNKNGGVGTWTSIVCWAACDRLGKIAKKLGKEDRASYWKKSADELHATILSKAWNSSLNSLTSTWGGDQVTAELLTLLDVGFLSPQDEKFLGTVKRVESTLLKDSMILHRPEAVVAKNSATFRYIKTLAKIGRKEEARKLFENMLTKLNSVGMISDTIDVKTGELWGNFPHNTATVGLIECANLLSSPWSELQQKQF